MGLQNYTRQKMKYLQGFQKEIHYSLSPHKKSLAEMRGFLFFMEATCSSLCTGFASREPVRTQPPCYDVSFAESTMCLIVSISVWLCALGQIYISRIKCVLVSVSQILAHSRSTSPCIT